MNELCYALVCKTKKNSLSKSLSGIGVCIQKASPCQFALWWTADSDSVTSVSHRLSPWILFLSSFAILWSFPLLLFNSMEERQDRMTTGHPDSVYTWRIMWVWMGMLDLQYAEWELSLAVGFHFAVLTTAICLHPIFITASSLPVKPCNSVYFRVDDMVCTEISEF